MIALKSTSPGRRASRGISLIIVLILMIIIGITASTAMRNATSEQRATNNLRVESSALQYAEAALRYCEAQMKILPANLRAQASLQGTIPGPYAPGPNTSGWTDPLSWNSPLLSSAGRASFTRTVVPAAFIPDTTDTVVPNRRPECVVETGTGSLGTIITARGFSPDWRDDNNDGNTDQGAVVWLQSFNN